jgi:ELWxxDGT repeat protein
LRLEPLEGRMLLSDGTAAGTVLVKDINPGGASSNPGGLADVNGILFFAANDGTHGSELWKSDGTASGTVLVADIDPGSASSYPTFLTVAGRHLFFTADDGVHGAELWDPPISPSSLALRVGSSPFLPSPVVLGALAADGFTSRDLVDQAIAETGTHRKAARTGLVREPAWDPDFLAEFASARPLR